MEPLTETDLLPTETKSSITFDRLKIGKLESEKVATLLLQAQASSKGFIALTKSDIVNFLIREHRSELSTKELVQLRVHHYDPVRHMNWITQALKEALMSGDMAAVASLQDEIKGIQLSVTKSEHDDGDTPSAVSRPTERIRRPRTKLAKDMEVPSPGSDLRVTEP